MLQKYLAIVAESQVTNGIIYDYSGKAQAEIQIYFLARWARLARFLRFVSPFPLQS